jgi:hypothetical protein
MFGQNSKTVTKPSRSVKPRFPRGDLRPNAPNEDAARVITNTPEASRVKSATGSGPPYRSGIGPAKATDRSHRQAGDGEAQRGSHLLYIGNVFARPSP